MRVIKKSRLTRVMPEAEMPDEDDFDTQQLQKSRLATSPTPGPSSAIRASMLGEDHEASQEPPIRCEDINNNIADGKEVRAHDEDKARSSKGEWH